MDIASVFSALNHNSELKELSYIAFQSSYCFCKPVVHDDHTGKYQKAYADPVHLKVEDMKAASTRSGKSKTHGMKTAKLNDALTSTGADEEALPVQDIDEWYNHNQSTGNVSLVQASSSSSTGVTDYRLAGIRGGRRNGEDVKAVSSNNVTNRKGRNGLIELGKMAPNPPQTFAKGNDFKPNYHHLLKIWAKKQGLDLLAPIRKQALPVGNLKGHTSGQDAPISEPILARSVLSCPSLRLRLDHHF
ncbi:hypothetical protein EDB19DRAFT_2032016 [Suillus lakei]|nr:hypothetical protein EDB19DRAFT_2032016 [Suillus lakei]